MESPKVSIFFPVFNSVKTVAKAIDSILAQSFNDFVLVISDDCSTDGTQSILVEYARKYPDKIRLFLEDVNLGPVIHFNKMLNYMSGEYICFTSGDDVFVSNKLEVQVDELEQNPSVGMVIHSYCLMDGDGSVGADFSLRESLFKSSDLHRIPMVTLGVMVRRDLLSGLSYTSRYADSLLFFEYILKSRCNVKVIKDQLIYYVRTDNSLNSVKIDGIDLQRKKIINKELIQGLGGFLIDYPAMHRPLTKSMQNVLRDSRHVDGIQRYREYLYSALALGWDFRSFVLLICSYLGFYR